MAELDWDSESEIALKRPDRKGSAAASWRIWVPVGGGCHRSNFVIFVVFSCQYNTHTTIGANWENPRVGRESIEGVSQTTLNVSVVSPRGVLTVPAECKKVMQSNSRFLPNPSRQVRQIGCRPWRQWGDEGRKEACCYRNWSSVQGVSAQTLTVVSQNSELRWMESRSGHIDSTLDTDTSPGRSSLSLGAKCIREFPRQGRSRNGDRVFHPMHCCASMQKRRWWNDMKGEAGIR